MTHLHYKSFSLSVSGCPVLSDVSFETSGPGVTVLLGPSGVGKSSLLKSTQRLIEKGRDGWRSAGDVLLDGESIFSRPRHHLTRRVGYIQQAPSMLMGSVLGNLEFALRANHKRLPGSVRRRAEDSFEKVGLADEVSLKSRASSLSGGQQQRLAIARAIALDPEVLLMDEPTSALDPVSSEQIEELIANLSKDRLIVMVTHKVALAERIGTTAGFLLRTSEGNKLVSFGALPGVLKGSGNREVDKFIRLGTLSQRGRAPDPGERQKNYLFVCSGNTSRSPMAQAIFCDEVATLTGQDPRGDSRFISRSAGLSAETGFPMKPEAREALKMLGLNPEAHLSRKLTRELVDQADVIICMTGDQCERLTSLFPSASVKVQPMDPHGNMTDPDGANISHYLEVAARIKELVRWRIQSEYEYPTSQSA